MGDEIAPEWAQRVLTELAVVNANLQTLINWAERNIDDHEKRLRIVEERLPANLREQLQSLNQFKWVLLGIALVSGTMGSWLTKLFGV